MTRVDFRRSGGTAAPTVRRNDAMEKKIVNIQRLHALDAWLRETKTQLTQINGQRKYGGPPEDWDGPTPGARCEIFINQIPRDTYEDVLIPLFSSVGPLWEFRLMMNFSGENRGFAYAKYGTVEQATNAIRLLHKYMLEPGCHLSVCRSREKRHISIGDLPATTRQEDLLQVLRVLAEGVERLSLKAGPGIKGVTAIVSFSSHHAASMAKRVLMEDFKKLFSLDVSIKWQSVEKRAERWCTQKAPNGVLPPDPTPIPGFCRAVGGLTANPCSLPGYSPSPSQGCLVFAASPGLLLCKMCEKSGLGQPLCEIYYSHTGPDGFLHFTYMVHIPKMSKTFKGVVMILPGPNALKEAERAAAQQVLQKLRNN